MSFHLEQMAKNMPTYARIIQTPKINLCLMALLFSTLATTIPTVLNWTERGQAVLEELISAVMQIPLLLRLVLVVQILQPMQLMLTY